MGTRADILLIIGIGGYGSLRSERRPGEKQLPLNPISHHEMMTTDEC
jgi:hypothetical protein